MKTPLSILGLFCEDIREESGEILTLVGLMPDTVNVELMSKSESGVGSTNKNRFLSNLCVFVRANFDPADPVKEIKISLVFPDDSEIHLGDVPPDTIEKAKRDAIEKGVPLGGVVVRGVLAGFSMKKSGVMRLVATIDEEKRVLAMLNFQVSQLATSSIDSQQPS